MLLDLVLRVRVLAPEMVEHARHRQLQRADHLLRHAVRAGLGHERRIAALYVDKEDLRSETDNSFFFS